MYRYQVIQTWYYTYPTIWYFIYVIELVNKYYGGTIPRMMFTFQQALEAIKKDSVMSKSCSLQHDVYGIFRLILVDETVEMQG